MSIQTVEIALPTGIDSVSVGLAEPISIVEVRQGPAGPAGSAVIDAATQSDGTADLDLLNVETVTATVTDTLTAPHIHGNLAGSVYAHIRAGEALEKGDPVYVSGSFGSGSSLIAEVSKADASNAAKMPAIGIMDEDVANNATGHMVITGTITELDTAGLTVNAELYVAAGGGMTATPPTARAQPVARVERANANNGAVIVKVNGLSASDATGNTLVRRTSGGGASLSTVTLSGTGGSPFTSTLTGGINFANRTLVLPDVSGTLVTAETLANSATITASTAVAVDTIVLRDGAGQINITNSNVAGTTAYASTAGWTYAGSAASAHRTALGLGTGDSPTFAAVILGTASFPPQITTDGTTSGNTAGLRFAVGNRNVLRASYNYGAITFGGTGATFQNFGYHWVNGDATTNDTNVRLSLTFGGNDILEQKRLSNPQESRIYGTYTDTSNYRRLALKMSSAGVAQIVAEGLGSGAADNRLEFVTGGATRMTVAADGNITTSGGITGTGLSTSSTANGLLQMASFRNFNSGATAVAAVNIYNNVGLINGTNGLSLTLSSSAGGNIAKVINRQNGPLELGTNNLTRMTIAADGQISISGTVKTGGYTFANLPSPATQGMRAYITDGADIPLYMANAAGGGSTVTPVFYNGTNWINA
jgi:hypothetical protein